jgi:hypothetical protein
MGSSNRKKHAALRAAQMSVGESDVEMAGVCKPRHESAPDAQQEQNAPCAASNET